MSRDWYNKHLQHHSMSDDNIVGWQVWYSDGSVYSSLDTDPQSLPLVEVQALSLYRKRTDGKQGLWRLMLVGLDWYYIPNSDVKVRGDWTPLENHDRITKMASENWLDHKVLL